MQFHLNFIPTVSAEKITHQKPVLFIGSCFSENIYQKLENLHFDTESNPFGIVFNPTSIAESILRFINKTYFTEEELFEKNGYWYCLDTHTSVYAETKTDLLTLLNQTIDDWHLKLKTADWLVLTFGSAYAYKHMEQNKLVANCHKLPQQLFNKELLDTSDIVEEYESILKKLVDFNSTLKVLFTISPVKHLKDGLIENTLSKAVLIQAVHKLCQSKSQFFYFPAYELVTDDLRDYRFYKQDMAHPNEMAIDYVWEKFTETFFNSETIILNKQISEIQLALQHRPLQPNSESFLAFKNTTYSKAKALMQNYPWLTFKLEN